MNVLVLLGGNSDEREVSLRSGGSVADAARKLGHDVQEYDPADGLENLAKFAGRVDAVLPILHGKGGEDGTIQAELEKLGMKYLGADSRASALCFDKQRFKEILNKLSIMTPEGEMVTADSIHQSLLSKKPHVLKPVDGGSTIDTFMVRNPAEPGYDSEIFKKHSQMLLEELIEGVEITVPVLEKAALPVIEIIPPEGKEFDYENKYNGATQELCPPPHVSQENQHKAQELAEKVHQAAGVRHLSRTDFIIDSDHNHWVLELNTMPGMTSQSLYPKSAKVAGWDWEKLVDKFITMAAHDTHSHG